MEAEMETTNSSEWISMRSFYILRHDIRLHPKIYYTKLTVFWLLESALAIN